MAKNRKAVDVLTFSVSPEFYVINLLIGIPVFFGLRWLLRKFIQSDKLRIILTWVGTILFTMLIYLGLVLSVLWISWYEPSRKFDQAKWFSDREKRFEMRDDIVESEILQGKTKKDVLTLIGEPDLGTDSTNIWNYDLGASSAGFGWQFNSLLVTFEQNKVTKVEKHEVID